jgi:nucleotide-binding universal stress UspA family protein
MKKILFVCDGDNFSRGAMEFIKLLHNDEPVFVKGIFFTPIDFQQLLPLSYVPIAEPYIRLKEKEKQVVLKSMNKFIGECESYNIKNTTSEKNEEWNKDLFTKETRFADAIVMSEELFCSDIFSNQPNLYLEDALRQSECPVILVPESFNTIDHVVVAYDGKEESMIALKQFCNLLPQLTELPTEFVYIKNEEDNNIPDRQLLHEYTKLHFSNSGVLKLHFDANKYFSTWVEEKKNILLVAGSFGRSAVSNLLRSSFTGQVIHDHKFPVFISHNI